MVDELLHGRTVFCAEIYDSYCRHGDSAELDNYDHDDFSKYESYLKVLSFSSIGYVMGIQHYS